MAVTLSYYIFRWFAGTLTTVSTTAALVRTMVRKDAEVWEPVTSFCEAIMIAKEEAEWAWEMPIPPHASGAAG